MIKFYDFFEIRFLKCKCGILKRFNTQNGLLSLVERCYYPVTEKLCRARSTDLSRAFDCISHDLLIAKLNAYDLIEMRVRLSINIPPEEQKKKSKVVLLPITF